MAANGAERFFAGFLLSDMLVSEVDVMLDWVVAPEADRRVRDLNERPLRKRDFDADGDGLGEDSREEDEF